MRDSNYSVIKKKLVGGVQVSIYFDEWNFEMLNIDLFVRRKIFRIFMQ